MLNLTHALLGRQTGRTDVLARVREARYWHWRQRLSHGNVGQQQRAAPLAPTQRGPLLERRQVRSRLALVLHEGELGGANVAVVRLLPLLRQRWDVTVWVPGEGATADVLERHGARVTRVARPYAFSARGLVAQPGPVRRLVHVPSYRRAWRRWVRSEDPDVVLFNSLLVAPELVDLPRPLRARTVLYVHELLGNGLKPLVALTMAKRADVHVAPSRAVATRLARAGIRAHVIHPGVPELQRGGTCGDANEIAVAHSLDRPVPVIGCVGTVCPIKGTDLYLAMLAELQRIRGRRFRARLVGRPPRGRWHRWGLRVLARAADSAVECRVPPPDADEAWSLRELAELDVLVVPSRVDACPLVVLEAMALGVPVVAFDTGGIAEQLGSDGSGVLVERGDVRALAAAVAALIDAPERRRALAEQALRRQRRLFTVERQAAALDAVLSALGGRPGDNTLQRDGVPLFSARV